MLIIDKIQLPTIFNYDDGVFQKESGKTPFPQQLGNELFNDNHTPSSHNVLKEKTVDTYLSSLTFLSR